MHRVCQTTLVSGLAMPRRQWAGEENSSPMAKKQRRDSLETPMVTCQYAQGKCASGTSSHQNQLTGTGVGLATQPSEVLALGKGEENSASTKKRCSNVDIPRQGEPNIADTVVVIQGVLTKCPKCTACYRSSNSMRMHLRRIHKDYCRVSGTKQSGSSIDPPRNTARNTQDTCIGATSRPVA